MPVVSIRHFLAGLLFIVPLGGLQAVEPPPELTVRTVEAGRYGTKGLAFKLEFAAKPDPARVRIFFDVDGPAKGEPASGADYMVEGSTFYRYPPGETGWRWETVGKVSYLAAGNTLTCCLPDGSALDHAKVVVQTTTASWEVAATWPVAGRYALADRAALPEMAAADASSTDNGKSLAPLDLEALLKQAPRSLSVRFEEEFGRRAWKPAATTDRTETLPLRFRLKDALMGKTFEMQSAQVLADGTARLLKGTTDGVDWQIVIENSEPGTLTATGRIHGSEARCLSITAAASIDLTGWTWHDDVRETRPISADKNSRPYATLGGSPYGSEGQVSIYPFAVVSRDGDVLTAETDISEPRIMRIIADPASKTFGVTWDLALSPGTKKFPGAATFRASWRRFKADGKGAFRATLQDFYGRQPEFARNRAGTAGLWMPFGDISKLPNPEDFGFAFFEKVGEAGTDVEYAHAHGVRTLRYTEPWLYWLPMPKDVPRTPAKAMELMRQLARSGDGRANAFASGGLLGGVRETDGSIRMKFQDVPWNSGARMEVSTDPGLVPTTEAPVSRAMAEWRDIQSFLADRRTDGIYLDSMSAMQEMDYDPAAIAVADYPLTYTAAKTTPGLATEIAHYAFTSALGNYLHARGKLVMGNFPAYDFPFFMPFVDVPGEETTWFTGGKYAPLGEAKLNYRRAMSGGKVWCFLLGAKFEEIPAGGIERYFRDCLFYGFQPGFFSHNGSDDTYWSNPKLYERDRPLFQKYMPLICRVALAGWQPVGTLRATQGALWVENFGEAKDGAVRHLTLRNASAQPVNGGVTTIRPEVPLVALEPLTGATVFLKPGETASVRVEAGQVRLWDVVPVGNPAAEIAFLEHWASPGGEGEAGAANLRAIARESAAGFACRLEVPSPAVDGEDNVASLEVRNTGPSAVTLRGFEPGKETTIPAGGTVRGATHFREGDAQGWSRFAWQIQRADGSTLECARRVRVDFAPAVEARVETERVVSRTAGASVGLTLTNRAGTAKKLTIRWQGDFVGGTTSETLAPGETKHLQISVAAGGGRDKGYVTVSAEAGGKEISRQQVYVLFMGESASAAAVSGVQVVTDSTYPGYSPAALTDGVIDGTNLPWNEAAWASDETGQPHFVRVVFPEPTAVGEATIYWHKEDGVRYTSQRGTLSGVDAQGNAVDLGSFVNAAPVENTRVRFPKQRLKSVELRVPANSGATERPGILWLSELEVK